ncbi:ABC transporter permease [Frateuria defendens]|uniref:ABC transporter permease n=1 Tax=Frateuria defendens TaxID=2219559 RepID=UPI00066FC3B2|nr:ABC transporter permease [Frateuria defendens]
MVALARKTLVHEWRRFLPAVLAVGFAGLLQLLQAALVLGIFGSASVYITGSSADLWVGYPGTQSVNLGRPIDPNVEARLLMDPAVARVEPFIWLDADWHSGGGTGGVSVFVSGIDPRADGMLFARALPPALRALLNEPDAVVVDRADLGQLGVGIGDSATINGRRVRVAGVASGLRALGGVNVVASLDTARQLDNDPADGGRPTYLVAQLHDHARAAVEAAAGRLRADAAFGPYEVWTARAFARRSMLYWILDTGAGAGVLFLAAIVFLVGAVITSQTLVAAVAGSLREYATLNALGVSVADLRWVVLEQALWVGGVGLLGAAVLGAALLALARNQDVPAMLNPPVALACAALTLGLAAVSGVAAVRGLRRADPATLLR